MIHLEIPRRLWLNANDREHWQPRRKRVAEVRAMGKRAAIGHQSMERAHLVVTIGWPDARRRDDHNLMPTAKAAIDGMVDAGLLPDDSRDHLTGPDLRSNVAGIKGVVVLDFDFQEVAR